MPCEISSELEDRISEHAREGERVLIVVRHPDGELESEGVPLALIAISDTIRQGAEETIRGFQEQGVTLKVISGDHAETVSTIAQRVGIKNADKYISCDTISDEELVESAEKYAVFGRVTPEQKVLLIKTLRINGHTVAMTGDGVNDTLALKESNCAIAMADGSEMARKVSHIVLMDSDFTALPEVVKEGRRCINNVRQSSVLYLMKTIMVILLSIISVVTITEYPLVPKNLLLLELFIIGTASLLLAIEPNNKRIEGNYLDSVIIRSFPNALAMLAPTIIILIAGKFIPITAAQRDSIVMCVILLVGFINLFSLCRPFTKWRAGVVSAVAVALTCAILVSIFLLDDMLGFTVIWRPDSTGSLSNFALAAFFITMGVAVIFAVLMQVLRSRIEKIIGRSIEKQKEREARRRAENGSI